MKILFAISFVLLVPFGVRAQDDVTQSVFVEVGGPSLVYSFNYDFRFDKDKLDSWGLRVGAGGYKLSEESLLTVPVQATRLFGNGRHYFELGAGFTFVNYSYTHYGYNNDPYSPGDSYTITETTKKDYHFIFDMGDTPNLVGTLNFGYRRIPQDGGFTFRANLTPLFNSNGFWPLFAGVGFGYAF